MAGSSEKTEKATPQRLKKARKDGEFPGAREFVSAIQFCAFILLAAAYFPAWIETLQSAMAVGLRQAFSRSLTAEDLIVMMVRLSTAVLRPLAFLGLALLVVTILFQAASTNLGFSLVRLTPNFNRLNPLQRMKEMPGNNIVAFIQAIVMMPVMFWLTWTMIRGRMPDLMRLPMMPVASGAIEAGLLLKDTLRKASFVLVLLGLVMIVRERSKYSKRLRMSKQDLRDEVKDTEGNPQTKRPYSPHPARCAAQKHDEGCGESHCRGRQSDALCRGDPV